MTSEQIILFVLVILIFALLIWGRFRYDLVAFGALVVAFLTGVVPKETVFAGFGHPAVVIIALVLIVSRGLSRSGAIELLAHKLVKCVARRSGSHRSHGRHLRRVIQHHEQCRRIGSTHATGHASSPKGQAKSGSHPDASVIRFYSRRYGHPDRHTAQYCHRDLS